VYAGYKAWSGFISPMVLGRSRGGNANEDDAVKETSSKRQEKLRKRQEKGDPRVRAVQVKK